MMLLTQSKAIMHRSVPEPTGQRAMLQSRTRKASVFYWTFLIIKLETSEKGNRLVQDRAHTNWYLSAIMAMRRLGKEYKGVRVADIAVQFPRAHLCWFSEQVNKWSHICIYIRVLTCHLSGATVLKLQRLPKTDRKESWQDQHPTAIFLNGNVWLRKWRGVRSVCVCLY